jgi:hypothetical protein
MERVAELMKERLRFFVADQRGLVSSGLREVAYVVDDGPDVFAVDPVLLPEVAHPGAASLALPGEIVRIKNSNV